MESLRCRRTQGDERRGRAHPARRLQGGDGRSRPCRAARALRPGGLVPRSRRLPRLGGGLLHVDQAHPRAGGSGETLIMQGVGLSGPRLGRVEDWMKSQIDRQRVAGLTVIMQRHGQTAFARSMGLADLERRRPMREDTIVRLYSMTKTLTAIGILMLYEEGQLQLDDAVHRWLPAFRDQHVLTGGMLGQWQTEPAARAVTVRDLLTHTSGLTYAMHGASAVDAMYRAQGIDHWSERDDLATVVDRLGAIP